MRQLRIIEIVKKTLDEDLVQDSWKTVNVLQCSKGRYTLVTKSNSTRSTMSLLPRTQWRQRRKDVRHLGDKNYPLSTKSFGDNVDGDKVTTLLTFDFVASVYWP